MAPGNLRKILRSDSSFQSTASKLKPQALNYKRMNSANSVSSELDPFPVEAPGENAASCHLTACMRDPEPKALTGFAQTPSHTNGEMKTMLVCCVIMFGIICYKAMEKFSHRQFLSIDQITNSAFFNRQPEVIPPTLYFPSIS